MKNLRAGTGMLLGGLLVLMLSANNTATRENPTVVVGTFDSRAVAIAFVRSAEFVDYLLAQQADVRRATERAKAAGDVELVAGLDALGPAMQERIHRQGFGAAPVDDIIARIEDELPGIAQAAGVDVIVSKWTLTYSGPAAKFVDVTDLLVAEFDPTEAALKTIEEILQTDPIPLDQLGDHED